MNFTDLQAALAPVGGQTTISTANLSPAVAHLLQVANSGQSIVISSAVPGPGDGENDTVVIAGVSTIFNTLNLPVVLKATLDGSGTAQVALTYTLLGLAPGPTSWTFSSSFPNLPKVPDWNQGYLETGSVALDQLPLFNASFVLVSADQTDADTGVGLVAGANFVSQVRPTGAVAFVESLFGQPQPLTLFGTIVPPAPAPAPPAVALLPGQWPWQTATPPPGINLSSSLGVDQNVGQLELSGIGMRVYTPLTADWLTNNPTYAPVLAYTGTLAVPSASVSGDVVAPLSLGATSLVLFGTFSGVSIANLTGMVDVLGHNDLQGSMPSQVSSNPLGDLQLTALALELSVAATGPGLTWASATIGMPHLSWNVWPGHFEVDSILTRFEVSLPFTSPSLSVTVLGKVEVEGVPVDIMASNGDGFVVYASLDSAQTIPLNSLMTTYAPEISPPGDLTVDAFQVAIAPTRYYGLALALANQPHPWTIPLGPDGITISDVGMAVTVPSAGSASGSIAGTITFGSTLSLGIGYAVPGPFTLRGTFGEVKLSEVLSELTNQTLAVPSGFDLDLTSSTALIQVQSSSCLFQLGTQVAGLGSFALQIQKIGGQWGIAAGMDLVLPASQAPGLSGLATLESFFALDNLLLVVSSFDSPGFTFPDLAAFNNPTIASKSITLPSQTNGIVAGLNVYAQWTFDTSNQQQLLQQLLGLHPVVGVTLQVGEDPATNSKLFVSFSSMINGLPVTGQFGGLVQGGEIGLFLVASIQVQIQGQTQTFDVVLVFVENGAFISGTMKGSTTIDFGSFRLGNLAVEIGVDWEGIPSLGIAATIDTDKFEASVAVFFDSAFPSKSLVAGSVSALSLADVLDTFVSNPPTVLDDVLGQIQLTGTAPFSIPGSVGAALDSLDMATVSAAFGAQKVIIPASISQVLLVNPDRKPGQTTPPGTRWYLTDMTADSGSGLRHYELASQKDGTIQVQLSPQFYCAPQATMIGSICYPQGFFITTGLDLFGWHASVTVTIGAGGIAADASMDAIVVGNASLLSLTGAGGVAGPSLSLATFSQPTQSTPELQHPHFCVSGALKFLGLTLASYYVDLTSSGFVFDIVGTLFPLVTYDVHGHFLSENDFGAGGSITVGFSNESIDLGLSSGPISLDTNAQVAVDVSYDGNDIVATASFTFTFQGQTLTVASFDLDITTGPLANIWQIVKDKIIYRLLHADITLHVDNIVQEHNDQAAVPGTNTGGEHNDQAGSGHIDETVGSHIDEYQKDWQGHVTSHQDTGGTHNDVGALPHLDTSTPHLDTAPIPHLDTATQHQDQGYHVDQGVEVVTGGGS